MDTNQIFKKALNLTWRYRALWLFGFLLALAVSNAVWLGFTLDEDNLIVENRIIISDSSTILFPGQGVTIDFRAPGGPAVKVEGFEPGWYRDLAEEVRLRDIWALLIVIGVVVLITTLLTILFRYTSQAALIRMVDENERSDHMVNVWRGLRLGWSRIAGKLFLIDLVISLVLILVFGLLFFLATSPLFLLGLASIRESLVGIFGISFLTLGGLLLLALLGISADVILSITRPVMYQACGVDGLGVGDSIRQAFTLLKTRFDRVAVTWLVWLAVRLVWTIAVFPALIILSPLILLTMLAGIVLGGLPALLAGGIASLFISPLFAWIIGAVFGLPLFILVTFSPIIFLSGLVEVFKSGFWTLSYREFRPLTSAVS